MVLSIFLSCAVKSSPAPLVWIIVGLLRGEFYTCARWPVSGSKCTGENISYSEFKEDFVLACQIPSTKPGAELDSCNAKLWNFIITSYVVKISKLIIYRLFTTYLPLIYHLFRKTSEIPSEVCARFESGKS